MSTVARSHVELALYSEQHAPIYMGLYAVPPLALCPCDRLTAARVTMAATAAAATAESATASATRPGASPSPLPPPATHGAVGGPCASRYELAPMSSRRTRKLGPEEPVKSRASVKYSCRRFDVNSRPFLPSNANVCEQAESSNTPGQEGNTTRCSTYINPLQSLLVSLHSRSLGAHGLLWIPRIHTVACVQDQETLRRNGAQLF